MSNGKWTPGPWGWEYATITRKPIALSGEYDDVFIATSDIDGHTFIDISDANAQLVRAAPDLLEACENCLLVWGSNSASVDPDEVCEMLQAAINKAKGEES